MQMTHDAALRSTKCGVVTGRSQRPLGGPQINTLQNAAVRRAEVQIFGDGQGGVVSLGARDCSLQRRNQRVSEEACVV